MEHKKVIEKSKIDAEIEEFIKNNKEVLYKKSSEEVGSRVQEKNREKTKAIDGNFTKVKFWGTLFNSILLQVECINSMDLLLF